MAFKCRFLRLFSLKSNLFFLTACSIRSLHVIFKIFKVKLVPSSLQFLAGNNDCLVSYITSCVLNVKLKVIFYFVLAIFLSVVTIKFTSKTRDFPAKKIYSMNSKAIAISLWKRFQERLSLTKPGEPYQGMNPAILNFKVNSSLKSSYLQ